MYPVASAGAHSDDYVCGNHCRGNASVDAHAKAKNRRNQSSSTSALYLGFVSASLLSVLWVYNARMPLASSRFRPAPLADTCTCVSVCVLHTHTGKRAETEERDETSTRTGNHRCASHHCAIYATRSRKSKHCCTVPRILPFRKPYNQNLPPPSSTSSPRLPLSRGERSIDRDLRCSEQELVDG